MLDVSRRLMGFGFSLKVALYAFFGNIRVLLSTMVCYQPWYIIINHGVLL